MELGMTKAIKATSHQKMPLGPSDAEDVKVERTMTAQTQKKTICPTPILASDEDILNSLSSKKYFFPFLFRKKPRKRRSEKQLGAKDSMGGLEGITETLRKLLLGENIIETKTIKTEMFRIKMTVFGRDYERNREGNPGG
jgi:hypothetical protein